MRQVMQKIKAASRKKYCATMMLGCLGWDYFREEYMVNNFLKQLIWSPFREGGFGQSQTDPLEHKET